MRRIITATLLAGALTVPVIGGLADSAEAICFQADGEVKIGALPYQGLGTKNTDGSGQLANNSMAEGETFTGKVRFKNISGESGKIDVAAVDQGTPNFRVRYFLGDKNITSAMENDGKTFKHIGPNERTRAIKVRVTAKPGSFGSERHVYLDGVFRKNELPTCAADRVGVRADLI